MEIRLQSFRNARETKITTLSSVRRKSYLNNRLSWGEIPIEIRKSGKFL
jgi:hypothetical protein